MELRDRHLQIVLVIVVTIILVLISVGRWLNYRVLFQPKWAHIWTPDKETYHDLYLKQNDESGIAYLKNNKRPAVDYINVWYFVPYPNEKIVLYCHGNNDNNSYRDYVIDICKQFHLNLLLVDYRGYGKSDGRPTSNGIVNDVKSAYAFLRKFYDYDDIIIWGESLGGSAAIKLAHDYPCHKLILLATFASLPDIIGNMKIHGVIRNTLRAASWLIMDNIKSKTYIKGIKCPIAIIHSREDDLIPFENASILYDSISHTNKLFIKIRGQHSKPIFTKNELMEVCKFIHTDEEFVPNDSDLQNIIYQIQNYS